MRPGSRKRASLRPALTAGWLLVAGCLVTAGLTAGFGLLAGCGTKIAVPQPYGLASVAAYHLVDEFPDQDPVQLALVYGNLYVLTAGDGRLTCRDLDYNERAAVGGFGQPTALCLDDLGEMVFVYDQQDRTVSYYNAQDLAYLGDTHLDTLDRRVQSCVALTACSAGIEVEPGARTFLYLADPDSGVVHRYVYDEFTGLRPFGILARSDGDAARYVHVPTGMFKDSEQRMLVCDADSFRNWVIRFAPEPDFEDVTADTNDVDPWRGVATLFTTATCEPPSAADYTLGDAAECNESGWTGGPSDAEGEFFLPVGLALDLAGRIYVADSGNDRVQIFDASGYYQMQFGTTDLMPGPVSVGVFDYRHGSGADDYFYGAYVFVVVPGTQEVRKFISEEYYIELHNEPPPER